MDQYAADVGRGAVMAGPLVRQACARHARDRAARRWYFDEAAATAALAFFETILPLPDTDLPDGRPAPFTLQPWQAFIVGSIFGWKTAPGGPRRFREAYLEIGKGNGKTPLAAGVGLYGLVLDGEPSAEIYSAATEREQARICWTDARKMVERSPHLAKRIKVLVGNLAYGQAYFRPLSSEHRGLDGKRPHICLIDELHEHPNGLVTNKLRAGAKGRRQFLAFEITNSGFDRTSICWQHHEHSRRVLEQTVSDDQWFAFVCTLDEGDDPLTDETCWLKTNPNLGVSIQPEYLRRQVQNARHIPAETNTVLRLNFCVWTQANTRFFDMAKWQACGTRTVSDAELEGVTGYGGLDLGQTDDFTAFVALFPLDDGRVAVRARFWLPRSALTKYPDRPYQQWERDGLLTVTEGETTDLDRVEDDVYELARAWGLVEIGYDKRFSEQMRQHLDARGLTMIDVPQGFYLTEAIRWMSAKVLDGDLLHERHAILTWMADNAVVREGRNQELRFDKDAAREKIDGIVAAAMAAARFVVQPADTESVYEERGVVVL